MEYSGIHWNPLESSWNRWGTLKYCWSPLVQALKLLVNHSTIFWQWHRYCYLLVSRVVSSHTKGLVMCMGQPMDGPITSFESLFRGARGLITICCSSDALRYRPEGLLGKYLRIRTQEIPQFSDVFWNSAITM